MGQIKEGIGTSQSKRTEKGESRQATMIPNKAEKLRFTQTPTRATDNVSRTFSRHICLLVVFVVLFVGVSFLLCLSGTSAAGSATTVKCFISGGFCV